MSQEKGNFHQTKLEANLTLHLIKDKTPWWENQLMEEVLQEETTLSQSLF
jgi:hypothetical protein